MKIKIIALILCAVMISSVFAVPVSAYQVYSWGEIGANQETLDWYNADNHVEKLTEQGLMPLNTASFSDGLLLVLQTDEASGDMWYNYVDKNGDLVDLNRGRFYFMSTFHDGLASARTLEGSQSYYVFVDLNGDVVLDLNEYFNGLFSYGEVLTSRFIDGLTIVTEKDTSFNLYDSNLEKQREYDEMGSQYTQYSYVIDTEGNLVEQLDGVDELINHPLYETAICTYEGVPLGVIKDPLKFAGTSTGSVSTDTETPDVIPPQDYIRPPLPEYADAQTHFQSKGKVTGMGLGDLDLCTLLLTVTNNTDYADSGVIAVACANIDGTTFDKDSSGVFFAEYYLEPHSSEVLYINHRNIAHMYMFGDGPIDFASRITAEALNGKVEARVIHFEDYDDLYSFYDIIPYEQNWRPRGLSNEFQPVCNGDAGVEFLNMLGVVRPFSDNDSSHDICRR